MEVAIVFLPLIGAGIAGLFGKQIGDRGAQLATSALVSLAAVLSVLVLMETPGKDANIIHLFEWIGSGNFVVNWALRIDTLTAVMLMVVTVVSAVVHIYSIGYMSEDKSIARFHTYLSLFTFSMLMLVTSDNLVQMFFGWEGVGVCSYLLIGFWYHKHSANAAAIKAFIVNRVGDLGFALGIFGVFVMTGSLTFSGDHGIFAQAHHLADAKLVFLGMEFAAMEIMCFLLFIGAMGKSAQLGLHTWLPDAMEGPTPVSALIHAATMVTAGVFMLARMSPLFELAPYTLMIVTYVGAGTALFAATVGLTQFDIKRVIAYSTCSQLGYMFFALGVSGYTAGIFHLTTHAFFKALLFLGAGAVIHAMHHEQDMRKMGGLWKKIPITYAFMWIGSLALAGIPPFAGYFSKDIVLESAFAAGSTHGYVAYTLGVIAAFLTAFYSGRLLFMTFHGKSRADAHTYDHAHEAPMVMILPLIPLVIGAIFAGWVGYEYFVGYGREKFWGASIGIHDWHHDIIHAAHAVPKWVKYLPLAMGILGLSLSYVFYVLSPSLPGKVSSMFSALHALFFNKWYFDELYNKIFVLPAGSLGRLFWMKGDVGIIDTFGPNGVANATRAVGARISKLQTGYIYHYAFAMLVGVVVLVTWYILGRTF